MNIENNTWNSDDSDNEYDEEYIQNDIPPPSLNEEFVNSILKIKHSVYNNTVLSPELGTPAAQSKQVLQEYLNKINDIYLLAQNAQTTHVNNDKKIDTFPPESRESIKFLLNWITEYCNKNTISDTVPYTDYIRKSFHEYQFVQNNNSFE